MDYRDRVLAARRASDSQPQEALARWTSEMQTYNGLLKGYREYLDGEFIDAAQADAEIRQAKGWQHENVVVSEINPYRNNREETSEEQLDHLLEEAEHDWHAGNVSDAHAGLDQIRILYGLGYLGWPISVALRPPFRSFHFKPHFEGSEWHLTKIHVDNIDKTRRKALRRLIPYFSDVADVDLASVDWHMRFDRNNQTYRMLMGVCWLVAKGLLQTQEDGSARIMDFLDEQCMSRLYERFVLEYYRREHPELDVGAPYIDWELDDGFGDLLPRMKSDVTLACGEVVLIIDAKYYSHATQLHFDRRSIHSANLYQIFTYVKNKEAALAGAPHEVSGMLLYARTDEDVQPEGTYQMSGNQISVRTLGLDMPFEDIRAQLDAIVDEHFQKNKTRVWEQTS